MSLYGPTLRATPIYLCIVFKQTNKQTNNNDLLEKDGDKKLHIQALIVWHSRSRQFISTVIKPVHSIISKTKQF